MNHEKAIVFLNHLLTTANKDKEMTDLLGYEWTFN